MSGLPAIPPAVLERGEQVFVRVLRRRHPNALFVVRDREGDTAVRPRDPDVAEEVARSSEPHLDGADETAQHLTPLDGIEPVPQVRENPASGKARDAT